MARVSVDIRNADVAGRVSRLPWRIRWEPRLRWLCLTPPAFVPSVLLLLAFGFEVSALLTVALVVLLSVAALRRLARQIPVYVVPTTIELDDSGVTLDMNTFARWWPWYTITDIHEGDRLLCIVYMHGRHWLLIPRSSFDTPSECASFLAEARELRTRHGQIPTSDDEARHADGTSVRIPTESGHTWLWIGLWMLAILLLGLANEASPALRVLLGVLGVVASWVASVLTGVLFRSLLHRGPRARVQALRIDDQRIVLEAIDGRISTSWAQLDPAKIQERRIRLNWIGGTTFVDVPRTAFVSDAQWSSFIDVVSKAQKLTS